MWRRLNEYQEQTQSAFSARTRATPAPVLLALCGLMDFSNIKNIAIKHGGSASIRNFDGEEVIMVVCQKASDSRFVTDLWAKGIFITQQDKLWTIGLEQNASIPMLNERKFKELLTAWLREPDGEFLINYVPT